MVRLIIGACAVAIALLFTACTPAPDRLGVSLSGDADLSVHYMRCIERGEHIHRVQLAVPLGTVDDDEVLWEIRRDESFEFPGGTQLVEEVVIDAGEVPQGFVESVPMDSPVSADSSLRVSVETSMQTLALGFQMDELEMDQILQANRQGPEYLVSSDSFRSQPKGCEPSTGILSGITTLTAIVVGLALLAAITTVAVLVRSSRKSLSDRGEAARDTSKSL